MSEQLQNNESFFSIEELFVSTTDKKGIILSGNDVFVRVSEYDRDALIHTPHNIIRHPDMPKTAFRLLWDTIGASEPFCAYVKNKSKSGKHYWVFACVIPLSSGHLSIRLKPTSPLLGIVENLYKQVLKIEKEKGGVNAGIAFMVEAIKSLGFASYTEFMVHALFVELQSRQAAINGIENEKFQRKNYDSFFGSFELMKDACDRNLNDFVNGVSSFSSIEGFQRNFLKQSQTVLDACRCLETLSLNMAVTANKLGKKGASLSLVSSAFQRAAKEVLTRFGDFGNESQKIADRVQSAGLRFGLLRLSIEIMSIVTGEVSLKSAQNINSKERERLIREQEVFSTMVKEALLRVLDEQNKAVQAVLEFKLYLQTLKKMMVSFDLIRMGGRLEGARSIETDQSFSPFINEMMKFLVTVEKPITEMALKVDEVYSVLSRMKERLQSFNEDIVKLEMYQIRAELAAVEAA